MNINTKKLIGHKSCKPEQTILFLNSPLIYHVVLESVPVPLEALLVAYVHILQNIAGFSYVSQFMRLTFCQIKNGVSSI